MGEALDLPELPHPEAARPEEEDLSKGILEAIDMDSYRVEKKATMRIQLPDADGEIGTCADQRRGRKPEPELDRLSNILKTFNDQFGNIPWTDADRIHRLITEDIPAKVAADTAYQNAKKNSDRQNARIEHDKALGSRHERRPQGRHGALQAVQRQRVLPRLADQDGVLADLRDRRVCETSSAGHNRMIQTRETHPLLDHGSGLLRRVWWASVNFDPPAMNPAMPENLEEPIQEDLGLPFLIPFDVRLDP